MCLKIWISNQSPNKEVCKRLLIEKRVEVRSDDSFAQKIAALRISLGANHRAAPQPLSSAVALAHGGEKCASKLSEKKKVFEKGVEQV